MDAMVYLEAADLLLEDYKEISYYDAVFEDVAADEKNNDEIVKKSQNLLQKGISAIRRLLEKIRNTIKDIMKYFKSDAQTRSAYDNFAAAIEQNREFAGKKVTFRDYEKIAKAWTEEMDDEENFYRGLKDEEIARKPSFEQDVSEMWGKAREKIGEYSKIAAKEVSVQYLLESAKRCQTMAEKANTRLKLYDTWIGSLEKDLGKREARIVKIKMRMLSSRLKIIRMLAGGKEKEYLTWKDAVKNIFTVDAVQEIVKRNFKVGKFGATNYLEFQRAKHEGKNLGNKDAERDQKALSRLENHNKRDIKKLEKAFKNDKLNEAQKNQFMKVQRMKRDKKYKRLGDSY
jgi:hypothetical protein